MRAEGQAQAIADSVVTGPFDINNPDLNYARSDFDRRHAIHSRDGPSAGANFTQKPHP